MGNGIRRTGEVGMRLIDADALAEKIMMDVPGFLDGGSEITKAFILAMVKTRSVTPTIDAIPVVRCKDCKFHHASEKLNKCWCEKDFIEGYHNRDWFCADGERK